MTTTPPITVTVNSKGVVAVGNPGVAALINIIRNGIPKNSSIKLRIVDSGGEISLKPIDMDVPARVLALLSKERLSKKDVARSAKMTAAEYDAFINEMADVSDVKLESVDVSRVITLLANTRLATFRREGI